VKVNTKDIERILETYSLEVLLELNDLTIVDACEFLLEEGFIELPNIKPLDVQETWDTYEIEELDAFES
jgi:hypothetical protein